MKTIIKWSIVIALFSIKTITYSQNFIDESKQWSIASSEMDLYSYSTTFYKFSGDSILNGKTYHKLYESTDSSQANWSLYSLWYERNDSVFQRGQVCGGPVLNDTTTLLYDFNIEEGDTFFNIKVDSIRFLEWGGSIRKFWFFGGLITWIEGVGNFEHFNFSTFCINSTWYQLLCFQENGNLVYQNPNFNSCFVNAPSIPKSQEIINLFPNPATTKLTITLSENIPNFTYSLYDMQGNIRLTGKTQNTQAEINVATLPRGLYVLKIITAQQSIVKKVILKDNENK